jgi:L-histidine N-alpha-methyltransferase
MPVDTRFSFIEGSSSLSLNDFRKAVDEGLHNTPKTLPSRYFYDHAGSQLFEKITELPEYYPTALEAEILAKNAEDIVKEAGKNISVIEFGSGSSVKTRTLISAILAAQKELHYVTIDISGDFLRETAQTLLDDFPALSVTAIGSEYRQALSKLPPADGPRLFVFLGSSLGNFPKREAIHFLTSLRLKMTDQDAFLIGVDQVKDRDVLLLAYNDPAGVTAEFNLNLLARINRELGGHFELHTFIHNAVWDSKHDRIEMRLMSDRKQKVAIDDLKAKFKFDIAEYIVTEWSHKYTRDTFGELAKAAGLQIVGEWSDPKKWFCEFLLRPL